MIVKPDIFMKSFDTKLQVVVGREKSVLARLQDVVEVPVIFLHYEHSIGTLMVHNLPAVENIFG